MRIPSSHRREMEVNMTPMIDVVFLLIIFFLVSSHLAQQEVQLALDLPTADSGQDPPIERGRRITVSVLPEGALLLGGEVVPPGDVARRLEIERARAGGKLEVRVRGDRSVQYRFVEPILLACARTGIWNVTFSVTRRSNFP